MAFPWGFPAWPRRRAAYLTDRQIPDHAMTNKGGDARTYVYTPELEHLAAELLRAAEAKGLRLAAAESCTGGALAALLTDVEDLSHVFERGFVVYSNEAKQDCLGIAPELIATHGPVSEAVATAMAQGALGHSPAHAAVAITGNAGPAGPGDEPGLVYICCALRNGHVVCREAHFGDEGRSMVRIRALRAAFDLLRHMIVAA
jgi:nicotinamide-nucleotide amidase